MSVLVVMENRGPAWNRMSWETLAAGQEIAGQLGVPVQAAVLGKGIGALAQELASKKLDKVYAVEHDLLGDYTSDAFTSALEQLIKASGATYVFFPHTYQVRDYAPKLATRFGQVLVSDVIAIRMENSKPTFVRLLFQGKLNGDVHVGGSGPYFASMQAGARPVHKL